MSEKTKLKPLSLALGTAVVSLTTAGIANAADDLFAMEELDSGYLTAGGHAADGSCGGDKDGSCGGDGDKDGSCGGDKDEGDGEGSCGEGKCGSA